MELKAINKPKLLNKRLDPAEELINIQAEDTLSQFNQNVINHQDLEIKTSAIISRTDNNPKTEQDFRKTCEMLENQKFATNAQLNDSYQKYLSSYDKVTSLYVLHRDGKKDFLHAFGTENEIEKMHRLMLPDPLKGCVYIAILPNGELFCFGDRKHPGITFIINSDYGVRVLPPGEPCFKSSVVYFNRNVYRFGGFGNYLIIASSSKYDLDKNRWVKLASMPTVDYFCSNIIFNGNILVSGYENRRLMLYSIDINSFSTIPYEFNNNTMKILINAERLYLIECRKKSFIYESNTRDEYTWKKIARSNISTFYQAYGLYNKGMIYIISENNGVQYHKFDLNQNKMFRI